MGNLLLTTTKLGYLLEPRFSRTHAIPSKTSSVVSEQVLIALTLLPATELLPSYSRALER